MLSRPAAQDFRFISKLLSGITALYSFVFVLFYILLFCICLSDGPENVYIKGPSEIQVEETLTLTCMAESEPMANYTWTLNGRKISDNFIFTKEAAELSDSGNYICEVTNDVTGRRSSASHEVSVTGTDKLFIPNFVKK